MTEFLFDKKYIFTVLNAEEAKDYEDKEGFFGNNLNELQDSIKANNSNFLVRVITNNNQSEPFICVHSNCDCLRPYALFLPINKVKKVEKRYRPYTLEEFNNFFTVGDHITFHMKNSDYRGVWLFSGYETGSNLSDRELVHLGVHLLCFEELFNDYEWMDKNENWRCFGVQE